MVPKVLQITENELCRKHRNHKKTLSWPPRKFVYCCAFNHNFLWANHFIFKVIFIQEVFKNIQGLLWKTQGLFKHITQFFTRVFYQHEVYLQITRYEMTQSSCKRDTKSKSHPSMRLAPVPVFSRKHLLTYTTQSVVKSWCMLVVHNSHKQKIVPSKSAFKEGWR